MFVKLTSLLSFSPPLDEFLFLYKPAILPLNLLTVIPFGGCREGICGFGLVDQPCSSFTHRENTNKVEFFITQISHDDIESPKCSLNSRKFFGKGKSNHGGN